MATSIKRHFSHLPSQEEIEMKRVLNAAQADLAALRAAFVALTAKLDTDFAAQNGVVTSSQLDVNYATLTDPAALELVS